MKLSLTCTFAPFQNNYNFIIAQTCLRSREPGHILRSRESESEGKNLRSRESELESEGKKIEESGVGVGKKFFEESGVGVGKFFFEESVNISRPESGVGKILNRLCSPASYKRQCASPTFSN